MKFRNKNNGAVIDWDEKDGTLINIWEKVEEKKTEEKKVETLEEKTKKN